MDISGRTALVTGGSRGIGAATALALAARGANVVISARRFDATAQQTLDQLRGSGRQPLFVQTDFHDPARAAKECVDQTLGRFGSLDILVHSAGGPVNGGLFEIDEAAWQAAFNVHVHAVFHLCRAAVPVMKPKREGAIILISSTAGLRGIVTNIAYQVAKGALPQMARALARELAADNIRVNAVAPGVIRTEFHAAMTEQQRRLNLEQRIPLRREGTPEDVAQVIVELIRNDYITGETFTIDGGLTMRIA
ncbi:MAG: glucose 1-dehydrogenase [Verrucomicrobia bacterium]|nr:glucose 1-dehydrogenase [Verrucomicrobiota bacterium]